MTAPNIDASTVHFVEGIARNREYFRNVFEEIFLKYDREFDSEEIDFLMPDNELDKVFGEEDTETILAVPGRHRQYCGTPLPSSQESVVLLRPDETTKYAELVARIKKEMKFDEDDPLSGYEDNAESGYEDNNQ